jgi:hypothetical protein
VSGGAIAYLKVEKPRFLFLEGSTGIVVAATDAAAALPDASAARGGASMVRAAPSVDCLGVGTSAPTPGTCSSAAFATLGEGSAGSHLSEGASPVAFFLFSLSRRRVLRGHRRRESLLLTQPVFLVPLFPPPGAPTAGSFAPSCVPLTPAPADVPRARTLRLGAWAGRTARRSRPPSIGKSEMSESQRCVTEE